ncbi:hypothetical protein VP01_250g2 [Puccinia sorghi]|uniref:Uncharacterized protein n=1 Tax=Puccinia sorghi TaxID=27349 RepID=A0A0L6V7F3_9BASI|nr:hypothetical protein VP01_250g2 [Puccinia sorghi]
MEAAAIHGGDHGGYEVAQQSYSIRFSSNSPRKHKTSNSSSGLSSKICNNDKNIDREKSNVRCNRKIQREIIGCLYWPRSQQGGKNTYVCQGRNLLFTFKDFGLRNSWPNSFQENYNFYTFNYHWEPVKDSGWEFGYPIFTKKNLDGMRHRLAKNIGTTQNPSSGPKIEIRLIVAQLSLFKEHEQELFAVEKFEEHLAFLWELWFYIDDGAQDTPIA